MANEYCGACDVGYVTKINHELKTAREDFIVGS